MKVKICVLTLLIVGLVLGFGFAYTASANFTLATNKNIATTIKAGNTGVVIGSFSVTDDGSGLTIDNFILDGSVGGGTDIDAADITRVAIYEDININGLYESGVDVLIEANTTPANITAFQNGTKYTFNGFTNIPFAAGEKRYYIVVIDIGKVGPDDGDSIDVQVSTTDTQAVVNVQTINAAGATWTDDTVAIVATHLKFINPGAALTLNPLTATTVEILAATGDTNPLIEAVDDYGNLDTGFGETVKLSAENLFTATDLTANLTSTGNSAGTNMVTTGIAMVSGVIGSGVATGAANRIDSIKYAVAGSEYAITLVATSQLRGLEGSTTVTVAAAYPVPTGVASTRGVEYYDTNHNGKIDRAAILFNAPIQSSATYIPIKALGAVPTTNSAFGVTGYTLDSTTTPLVKSDNGGAGVRNGGEYAVTLTLTEGSSYDTDATPQLTYDAGTGTLEGKDAGPTVIASIDAASATEVDKARPVLINAKTVDTGNGGVASNGKVDGFELLFSEPIDGATINTARVLTSGDVGSYAFALAVNDQNGTPVSPMTLKGTSTNTGNETFIFAVNEGAFRTTDAVPVLLYNQSDAQGYIVVDNATDVDGNPNRNDLFVDFTILQDTAADINVKDGVAPVVNKVTTNDSDNDGKLDKFTVEFTEQIGIKYAGVSFVSSVSAFGTYTAVSATAVTGKIINYVVAEKGAGIYDTEAVPNFAYSKVAGQLYDFGGNELPDYVNEQLNPTADGAAPVIVLVTSGDNYTDTAYAGNSAYNAAGANGRVDTWVVEFSEKATTADYSGVNNEANLDNAVNQFDYNHADGAAIAWPATAAVPTLQPAPTWVNIDAGDTKTTITIYTKEFSHATASNVNGGDTGVALTFDYDLDATASRNFKDATGNTTPAVAALAVTDGAAPFIVNGLAAQFAGAYLQNVTTVDSDNITHGSDYNTGDGYIDGFIVKFTETVYLDSADDAGIPTAFVVNNGANSSITMNIGFDIDGDGDVNLDATGVADTSDDLAGAAGFTTATLYGTSSEAKDLWDTGATPTLQFAGGVTIYDASDNNFAPSGAIPSYDGAKPVAVLAVGGVDTDEIKVTWSETVYSDAVGTGWGGGIPANTVFGYTDADGAGASEILVDDIVIAGNMMTLKVDVLLTLSDVENDSTWVKGDDTVFDFANQNYANLAVNEVAWNLAGTGYKIIINDIIAPWITSATTVDADGNGFIDHIRFTFSELIDDGSLNGYISEDALTDDVSATWQLEGYTGTAKWNLFDNDAAGLAAAFAAGEPVFTDNNPNDTVLYLKIEEDKLSIPAAAKVAAGPEVPGTTAYAGVLTVVATGDDAVTLADNKPNVLDVASSESDAVNSGDNVVDDAGPVLVYAETTSTSTLDAWFSEEVDFDSVTGSTLDFTLCNIGGGYAGNFVCVQQATPGILTFRATDANAWVADMGGRLFISSPVDDLASIPNPSPCGNADAYTLAKFPKTATTYTAAAGVYPAVWTAANNKGYVLNYITVGVGFTPGEIGAPADLVITDVPGDNGHWFYASFTVSPDHLTSVRSYQFYREVALDEADPNNCTWVYESLIPAGVVDGNNMSTCLVPSALDGVTRWAVVASTGEAISSVVPSKEAEVPVAMLVDGVAKTAAGVILSAMSEPALGGSIDNVAPSSLLAFAAADGETGIQVTWTAPDDHGLVGSYGSLDIPIYGVDTYEVYRKIKGADEFVLVGSVSQGEVSFADVMDASATVYQYYVKSLDSNPDHLVSSATRSAIAATGLTGDFSGDSVVNASDFAIFGANYNKIMADDPVNWITTYDLNGDGVINASDFAIFGANYGATLKLAKAAALDMPTSDIPFAMGATIDESTSTYFLNVNIGETETLKGFEFYLSYNTEALEFVKNSVNGLVGLNITNVDEDGIIRVSDWFVGEQFDGTVTLAFRSTGVNSNLTFEILNAIVDDVDGLALSTNVSDYEVMALPTVYALTQNYPNPFNPTTTIDYSIPKSGNVELVIFNMTGQKVRTLVSGKQDAAFYKIVWDGRNDLGENVASGMYFYRLVSGSFSKIEKMTLIK